MARLGREGRGRELANLPAQAAAELGVADAAELRQRVEACPDGHLSENRAAGRAPADEVEVPDEYSALLGVVGLFPLAAGPVWLVTRRAEERTRRWFLPEAGEPAVEGRLVSFAPGDGDRLSEAEVKGLLERLARTFAPVFLQDVVEA